MSDTGSRNGRHRVEVGEDVGDDVVSRLAVVFCFGLEKYVVSLVSRPMAG